MERLISLGIGYLFGIFQTAYIYGRMNGIDIREHGSGNAGTTNALRVLGKKAGIIVLLGDVAKTVLAVVAVRVLFHRQDADWLPLLGMYAAAGAILGHTARLQRRQGNCLYGRACSDAGTHCNSSGGIHVSADGPSDQVCIAGIDFRGD